MRLSRFKTVELTEVVAKKAWERSQEIRVGRANCPFAHSSFTRMECISGRLISNTVSHLLLSVSNFCGFLSHFVSYFN